MGRDINESGGRRTRKPKQKASSGDKAKRFYSIFLTQEEKKRVADGHFGIEEALGVIQAYLDRGHSVKLTYRDDQAAVCASLWENTRDFTSARCLSGYHNTAEKALISLGLGLDDRYEGFPDYTEVLDQTSFDW